MLQSNSGFTKLFLSGKRSLALFLLVRLMFLLAQCPKNILEELRMGHQILLAYTPNVHPPLLYHLTCVFVFSRSRETSWSRGLLRGFQLQKPGAPVFLAARTSLLQVLPILGIWVTREIYSPLPSGEQGRLSPKMASSAPAPTKGQALCRPELRLVGKVLGGE